MKYRNISLWCELSLKTRCEKILKEKGLTMSEFLRGALTDLDNENKEQK